MIHDDHENLFPVVIFFVVFISTFFYLISKEDARDNIKREPIIYKTGKGICEIVPKHIIYKRKGGD